MKYILEGRKVQIDPLPTSVPQHRVPLVPISTLAVPASWSFFPLLLIPLILSNSKSPLIHSSFAQLYSSNLYIILHRLPTSVDVLHPQQELHQDLHQPRSLPVKGSDLPSLSHKVHESCSLFLRKTSVNCPWSPGPQTFICSYPYLQGTHFHSEISCHLKLLQAF